jgi:hypothetical protein
MGDDLTKYEVEAYQAILRALALSPTSWVRYCGLKLIGCGFGEAF